MHRNSFETTKQKNKRSQKNKQIDYIFSIEPFQQDIDLRFISDHALTIAKFTSTSKASYQTFPNRKFANTVLKQL